MARRERAVVLQEKLLKSLSEAAAVSPADVGSNRPETEEEKIKREVLAGIKQLGELTDILKNYDKLSPEEQEARAGEHLTAAMKALSVVTSLQAQEDKIHGELGADIVSGFLDQNFPEDEKLSDDQKSEIRRLILDHEERLAQLELQCRSYLGWLAPQGASSAQMPEWKKEQLRYLDNELRERLGRVFTSAQSLHVDEGMWSSLRGEALLGVGVRVR